MLGAPHAASRTSHERTQAGGPATGVQTPAAKSLAQEMQHMGEGDVLGRETNRQANADRDRYGERGRETERDREGRTD